MTPILVMTTLPNQEQAQQLAELLVAEQFAACVHVQPGGMSVYRWEGRVERAQEFNLLIKTFADRFDALRQWMQAHHPYDVPELVGVPIEHISPAYLNWMVDAI